MYLSKLPSLYIKFKQGKRKLSRQNGRQSLELYMATKRDKINLCERAMKCIRSLGNLIL